jgi:hypothetical protein
VTIEDAALASVAEESETQRLTNGWPHLIRSAVCPGLDKVIVGVATNSHSPVAVSMDPDTAKQFIANVGKCLGVIERGEHRGKAGGGNPPPAAGFRGN